MKVLLLASPRSGSTTLLKSLSKTLNLRDISISDNYQYPNHFNLIKHIIDTDNVIVRTSVNINHGFDLHNFINYFDYTILLSRLNDKEHRVSFANLYYKNFYKKSGPHDIYSEKEIPKKIYSDSKFISYFNSILEEKNKLIELSKFWKKPILYYENIYKNETDFKTIKNIIPSIDIELLKINISSSKKMNTKIEYKLI